MDEELARPLLPIAINALEFSSIGQEAHPFAISLVVLEDASLPIATVGMVGIVPTVLHAQVAVGMVVILVLLGQNSGVRLLGPHLDLRTASDKNKDDDQSRGPYVGIHSNHIIHAMRQ
jgi:hypothetical protein